MDLAGRHAAVQVPSCPVPPAAAHRLLCMLLPGARQQEKAAGRHCCGAPSEELF